NGRFVTEDLTKTIRNGQIDYARYAATYGSSGVPQPWASELFLLDRDSVAVRVYQSGNELVIEKGGIGSSTFTGQGVKVLDYKVYIWPALNPFSGGSVQEQPTATLFLNLESNLNPRDVVRLPFQITVATRQYSQ
ncbi:MAG: hypothetical protein HYW88_03500, partial [Candidatus Sungbacteria bacterium]|nr:hypothetical protein [Candidatus Sungbacteria bacterium]